jgi:hypothetical protein
MDWDRPVGGVVAQPPVDLGLEHGDLPVVELDQIPQRLHPERVALIEASSKNRWPSGPKMSSSRGSTPCFANTA